MYQVALSDQEVSTSSTSVANPSAKVIDGIDRNETLEDKIECGLEEVKSNRTEEVEKLSPGCTVTANDTNSVNNKNSPEKSINIEEKLETQLLPPRRPSVYIVRPNPRLGRQTVRYHAALTSQVTTVSAQYTTPPPSDSSSSPSREDVTPNSLESHPMKESAAPKVIYQSTGIQTLPPGDNSTFKKIYGRYSRDHSSGLDLAGTFTRSETGLGAMGRFGKDFGIHTYDLVYGRRFRAPVPNSSVDFQNKGFQTMEISEREMAIKKAKVKAAMQVMRLKPWMDKFHHKAFPEPRENMIVHSEQRQVWVEIDKRGQVGGTAPFPNVVCTETYSTGPPEPISVFLTCEDDADTTYTDDLADFIEYPMPDWDTEEFVVQTVQALPLDRQLQAFKGSTGGKTTPSVASKKTGNAQSGTHYKATRTTVEREHSFNSDAQENKINSDWKTTSTDKTKLVSSVACTIRNSIDVPKGSSEPHEEPLYLPKESEQNATTTGPRPNSKTGEPHTPIIPYPPWEESILEVVPRKKGSLYSTDNPKFGTRKITSDSTAKKSNSTINVSDSQGLKKISPLPSNPRTYSISIASTPSAAQRNRIAKQANSARQTLDDKIRTPEPHQNRKANACKEASQLPNALFGTFRRRMDKMSTPASQHDSSTLKYKIMGVSITSISSSAPTTSPLSRRCNSFDAPSGVPNTLSTNVPSASASQHILHISQNNPPKVPPTRTKCPSLNKRGRNDEEEDLVDYSDSELIPGPKKQRLEDQEGDRSNLYEQATKINSLSGRAAEYLERSARVVQQQFPLPPRRQTNTQGLPSQEGALQQLSTRGPEVPQQTSQQAIPQLQRPSLSQNISSRQTPTKKALSQQTAVQRAPSRQASSLRPTSQDATSRQSTSQPTQRNRELRQGMNWALSLAGTGLLIDRKTK
jgi:hypothetical protein